MQKEMIVRFLLIFVFFPLSLISQSHNDSLLLKEVLDESQISRNDSISFEVYSSNELGLAFFNRRNMINYSFSFIYDDVKISDSLYIKPKVVKKLFLKTTKDNYLNSGKGVNTLAESFLKDSFSCKKLDKVKWVLSEDCRRSFVEGGKKKLLVSKPIYNTTNSKAIIYKIITAKNFIDRTLYFFEKKRGEWLIVFSQTGLSHPIY